MQEYKKDYRKYSYSENNIKDLPKDIILSIQEITNPPIKSEEITNLPKKKSKYSYYIFKRFMMFIIHLSLISLFEILFFFTVIVKYENLSMTNVVDAFSTPIINVCNNFNNSEKLVFSQLVNTFVNITQLNNEVYNDLNERNGQNNIILRYAWTYFGVITGISLITIVINFLNFKVISQNNELNESLIITENIKISKKQVNLIKIIIDNIIMIIILGLYEYLFFETIIIKYLPMSNNELIRYFMNKITICF